MKRKKSAVMLSLVLFTAVLTLSSVWAKDSAGYDGYQEHEKIIEEVEVINIEVPVRVFYKKKPVEGLKKSDFRLFVGGEEREINGFYQVRKKLERPSPDEEQPPRLFVLIFNIGSASSDLEKGMETFFNRVVRPNDRIMVLTNNVFLKDRVVKNPQKEREKVIKILAVETRIIWHKLIYTESNLEYMAAALKYELENPISAMSVERAIRRFLREYEFCFSEFRDLFFNPPEEQYLNVAKYLKEQQVEKWIFHFYEIPEFPQLKHGGGTLYKAIDDFFQGKKLPNPYVFDLQAKMGMPNDLDYVEQIGKIFLNTGATFHTLLLNSKNLKFFEEYDYRPVSTDSEHIFREVTRMTRGKVIASNDMEKFVKRIVDREDVYYMLTYAPKKSAPKGKAKIRVALTNEKYRDSRIVYDNQYRAAFLRKTARKVREEISQIRIRQLEVIGGVLYARISGIQMAPGEEKGIDRGTIVLSVKLLSDRAVLVSSTRKAFKTRAADVPIRLRLPGLKAGSYQVFFEVDDMNSGRNDLVLEDFNNPRDYVLKAGEEPFQFIKTPIP
jgi:hypothetical protein